MVEDLSKFLGMPPESLGMTSTIDRFLDTGDLALLSKEHSLRVRQKLDNMYGGDSHRLTYKFPISEHNRLFIREELKTTLSEPDFDAVVAVFSGLADGLAETALEPTLVVQELAREANLGERGAQLNLSIDRCSYCLPGLDDRCVEEFVFELESHGVDDEVVLKASDWVLKNIGGREAAQPKYGRGLRLLGKL